MATTVARRSFARRREAKGPDRNRADANRNYRRSVGKKAGFVPPRGHDIDATGLSYKAGDGFKTAAPGVPTSLRCLSTPPGAVTRCRHIPAVRPRSGRAADRAANPPPGATFECVLLPEDNALFVIASDAGYGFVVRAKTCKAKNKAGKALLSLPKGCASGAA